MTNRRQSIETSCIRIILRRRGSPIADDVAKTFDVSKLPRDIREKIVHELVTEFTEYGLMDNSEPNKYGLEVEDLISACKLALDD